MNNVSTLHLKDKNFLSEKTGVCELLFKVSRHKLSYAIRNIQTNELYVIYDALLSNPLKETIKTLTEQNNYLNLVFSKVKISIETFDFVFIPAELYTELAGPSYTNFVQTTKASRIASNKISEEKVHVISSIDESFIAPLMEQYPGAKVYSQAEALVQSALSAKKQQKGMNILIQFNTGSFEVAIVSDTDFIYYNIFLHETVDDYNYFLLLIKQQFGLEAEHAILLSGEVEKYSDVYRRTAKYFNNIRFADSHDLSKHSETFTLLPSHQFFSLLSMSLCE